MDHHQWEEQPEEDAVEITDLNQDGEASSSASHRFYIKAWLFSPRYRKQKAVFATICAGLALLVVLWALTPINRLFQRGPLPTTGPSSYNFTLDANPPWGWLSIDGKRAPLFSRGAYTLFSVPPGQHSMTWHAAPFAPQQCSLSVPPGSGYDTCLFPNDGPELTGTAGTVSFPTRLSVLSAAQRTALIQVAQAALDRQQSGETALAGEMYAQTSLASGTSTRSCTVVLQSAALCYATAPQPLKATLRLQLDTGPSSQPPCANGACDSGQTCRSFCDLSAFLGSNILQSPAVWQASVSVQLLWQFTTPDGRVVEENQADSFILGQQTDFPVTLNITWNGTGWDMTPGHLSDPYVNENPVCQAAAADMNTLAFTSIPSNTDMQMVPGSGPTFASGCLIAITLQSGLNSASTPTSTSSPTAYVIQRFGVLLAVNAAAHRLWPFLPVADTYAQRIAQQMIAGSQG
jgi:hypothetical protein